MPLHKPPPQLKSSAIDTGLRHENSHYRRCTLQTVRELSSEDGTPNDIPPPEIKDSILDLQNYQKPGSRGNRRRSLPYNDIHTQRATSNIPTDPTTPFDWGRRTPQPPNGQPGVSAASNLNRLPVEPTNTYKPLHRQVSNLKPRRHSLPHDGYPPKSEQSDSPQTSQLSSKAQGKQPVRAQNGTGRFLSVEGWNARRDKELKKREKEAVEARMRREKERRGLVIGSSSPLPSLSPPPTKPNEIYIRSRANQQELLQNNGTRDVKRSTSRLLVPRPSIGTMNGHIGSDDSNTELVKSTSTNNSLHITAHYDPDGRPYSTTPTWNAMNLSGAASQRQSVPAPQILSAPMCRSFSSSTITAVSQPPDQIQPTFPYSPPATVLQDRPSRTPSSQERSSRRSSISSTTTTTTSLSISTRQFPTSISPSHSRSLSSHHAQNGVTKEHLDTLAALTSSTPTPDVRTRPESVGSLEPRQRRPSDSLHIPSSSSSRPIPLNAEYCSKCRTSSRASRRSYATSSNYSTAVYGDGDANPQISTELGSTAGMGLGSENVLLLREREKLLRWKAEREKMEAEKREREKVKERVRRANEMEEDRRKQLNEKGNKEREYCGCLVM